MRLFMRNYSAVEYVTKEKDIARVVRETEQEVRSCEQDLQSIGIKEAEFDPVYLLFDEMIAFAKIADVKNLRHEIGSGLIYRQGVDTKPREFLASYIEKGALSHRE